MATFTVTTTTDDPNDPGSLRSQLTLAANSPGAVIAFNLPANSTITLTNSLPNPSVSEIYDFTGAPGLTITAAGATYSVIRDYAGVEVYGALNIGAAGGAALLMQAGANAILHGTAQLISSATGQVAINDIGGGALTLESGARVSSVNRNAIYVANGVGQQVTIGSGASVSNTTGANGPAIYVDTNATGARISNAGTISSVGATALQLSGDTVVTNTGTISTGANTAVFLSGGGNSITSSGVISAGSALGFAIGSNAASGTHTINLQAGSVTTGNVGSNAGASFAITVAGTINGSVYGGTADDTATFLTSANLAGLTSVNLGAGANTVVLDGAGTGALDNTRVVNVANLVKSGAGSWTLSGAGAYTGVTLNGGLLELTTANGAGAGPITFGAGAQTLQLDGRAVGGVFEDVLQSLGAGDRVDVRGIGTAASAIVSGNAILLRDSGGATIYTLNVGSGASLSGFNLSAASDGAGGTVVSLASPAPPSSGGGGSSSGGGSSGASTQARYDLQITNLARTTAADAASPTIIGPNGLPIANPLYAQAQAELSIAAQLDSGRLSAPDAQTALFHLVDGTTSVAEISYAFFTGRTPSAAGLNYLVHSSANATDLNDPYYAQFSTENRYINFAVALARGGANTAAYHAAYDALSLSDATARAYQAIFGQAADAAKVSAILNALVPDGLGGTETRAQYFAQYGGDGANGTGTKAAAIGFLLADSVREGFGTYQQANLHFLADLAHGTAAYNVDLLAAYGNATPLVGAPVADPTVGG